VSLLIVLKGKDRNENVALLKQESIRRKLKTNLIEGKNS